MEGRTDQPEVLVSVIMGVYNQWDQSALNMAVGSILRQTLKDLELIIYDDGSAPGAAAYIRALVGRDPRIRVSGAAQNHGLAFSLNACIGLARGKYIARMDADDVSAPYRLMTQYRFLESHPQYSWCGTNAKLFSGRHIWGERRMPEKPEEKDFLRFSPYIHPSVMYRREIFDTHNYLISEETLRCEDYEIFMRLRQHGLRGYNIQKPLFYYREDLGNYNRRTMQFRLNEARLRYRNFKDMQMLWPFGWLYVIRPVAGGLMPGWVIAWLKRKESGYRHERKGRFSRKAAAAVQKTAKERSGIL